MSLTDVVPVQDIFFLASSRKDGIEDDRSGDSNLLLNPNLLLWFRLRGDLYSKEQPVPNRSQSLVLYGLAVLG